MPASGDLGSLNTLTWEHLQELADALEQAWQKGPADLAEFLPPPGAADRALILHELIKTDLECRWRHGRSVDLGYYLERFAADLGSAATLPAALVYEEYRVRQLFGDRPPLDQFRTRFPTQIADVENMARANPLPESATLVGAAAVKVTAGRRDDANPVTGPHVSFGKDVVLPQTGGFTLIERIGTGAFAEVWKAKAPGGVLKAIKIIIRPLDQEEAKREFESLELIKNLRHHFLLPVHSFWALDDRLIIMMDLADGSLRDCLNRYRKEGKPAIPLRELLRYLRQTAEAIDYLHEKKVQHRDLKPENILLTDGHVRVADFGLAKAQGTQRLMSGTFAGTPLYMPPETWEDKTHVNGDQYSLAATFFELRTGRRLYKDTALPALMHSHLHQTPSLDPLGQEEQSVLLKALSKNPEDRYADCQTFVNALVKAVAHEVPADNTALPPSSGNATATDSVLNTVIPGKRLTPAANSPDTLRPATTLTPPVATVRATRSLIGGAGAAALVAALLALPAWFLLNSTPVDGDLTLRPLPPVSIRAGQTATVAVAIERDHFSEPVTLTLTPSANIRGEEVIIPAGATRADMKLTIAAEAAPGPRPLTLAACGGTHCAYATLHVTIRTKE